MKTTLFRIVAMVTFVAIAWVVRSRRSWRSKSIKMVAQLIHLDAQEQQQHPVMVAEDDPSFQELPHVVKVYLRQALQLSSKESSTGVDNTGATRIPWVQAVMFQQTGSFRIQDRWVRFTAKQYISAMEPIGFMWDATMLMSSPWGLDVPVSVRDVYLNGKGSLEASFGHFLTLADLHDDPQIDLGEEQRWLAEAFIVPSALLQSKQIQWSVGQEKNQAKVVMKETVSGSVAEMIVEFDSTTGLPTAVYSQRPKTAEDGSGKIELAGWVGKFYDYQVVFNLLVPTRMEAGWINEKTGELELYFKGSSFGYDYAIA